MACSAVNTKESRPNTIEAGSLGGPGVNPFHSKEEGGNGLPPGRNRGRRDTGETVGE